MEETFLRDIKTSAKIIFYYIEYIQHIALCTFKVYHMLIWYIYILQCNRHCSHIYHFYSYHYSTILLSMFIVYVLCHIRSLSHLPLFASVPLSNVLLPKHSKKYGGHQVQICKSGWELSQGSRELPCLVQGSLSKDLNPLCTPNMAMPLNLAKILKSERKWNKLGF